jgi:putative ABC transport system permease protein
VAGDASTMDRDVGDEKGVMVSETLANKQGIRLGQVLVLNTPSGPLQLPVLGIVLDFSNQLGAVLIDRKIYLRTFQDDTVDLFRVYIKPGFTAEQVRAAIGERVGKGRRLFVLLNANVRDFVSGVTNQWFGMTYLQVFVSVLVAILGIVNTLTVSIVDRRREFGVLRAMGGLPAQIRRTIWMEAIAIGGIGLILGTMIGAVNLYYQLEAIGHDMTGFTLNYAFPWSLVAMLVPVILLAAFCAAIMPAEGAVRGTLVEALEYE